MDKGGRGVPGPTRGTPLALQVVVDYVPKTLSIKDVRPHLGTERVRQNANKRGQK